MALKTMIENLNKARAAYEAQLKSLGKTAQRAVVEELAPLIPNGCKLRWTQYTPYFNDGEACVFSIHEPYVSEDESDEDGCELSTFTLKHYGKESWAPELVANGKRVTKTALDVLRKAWSELPKDLLEKAFGDHVEIIIWPSAEFNVSEYSHD